jgi:hypothetical protein
MTTPTITKDDDGRYSVMIAPNTFLVWWSVGDGADQRFYVRLSAPRGAEIGLYTPSTKH